MESSFASSVLYFGSGMLFLLFFLMLCCPFSHFLLRHPFFPLILRSIPLFHVASGQHQGVFSPRLSTPSISSSLSPRRPLIFMWLAGPPRSASLSPPEREEADYCQGLMDFGKTQTAMHHICRTGEREDGCGAKPEGREKSGRHRRDRVQVKKMLKSKEYS